MRSKNGGNESQVEEKEREKRSENEDSITHEIRRIVRVAASPLNLCSWNENLEEKRSRRIKSCVGMDDNERGFDNVEEIIYKGRVNIIATKILAHRDYEGSKETKIFCTM